MTYQHTIPINTKNLHAKNPNSVHFAFFKTNASIGTLQYNIDDYTNN